MKTNVIKLFTVFFIALSFTSCSSDDDAVTQVPDVTDAETLTEALQAIHNNSQVKGFTVGVVKNGTIAYQKSFGFQNVANGVAYTNQTLQPIGSISKTFIGAAVAKGVSLGYFTLETPINDVLPNAIVNPNHPNDVIKIKHLVNHTSSLVDNDEIIMDTYYILQGENTSTEGASLMQQVGISQRAPQGLAALVNAYYYEGGDLYSTDNFSTAAVGTQASYSNIASSLAAYIVEVAAGMPYQDFVDQYILTPLQMESTGYFYNPAQQNMYATLYFDDLALPRYNCDSFPDGFLKTNNDDMANYLLDMIKGATGNSGVLFDATYYDMLFNEDAFGHGLFWERDGSSISHNGSDPGLTCNLEFDASTGSGFFILTNYDSSTDEHVSHIINVFEATAVAVSGFLQH
ncbi:serine hydrolase [Flavobacterium suaedae]|uniref:Serine hydrolase n=1 Tax=Flavobacterium suaedae TaxID=1767027 RepID=A0ABQ1JZH0_9FLAO|nr:serine hydrolase domain-containing protein [Flavobacterium suaedae]GGB79429.1 serine hydrolase [Flavobacterium suaedae]